MPRKASDWKIVYKEAFETKAETYRGEVKIKNKKSPLTVFLKLYFEVYQDDVNLINWS